MRYCFFCSPCVAIITSACVPGYAVGNPHFVVEFVAPFVFILEGFADLFGGVLVVDIFEDVVADCFFIIVSFHDLFLSAVLARRGLLAISNVIRGDAPLAAILQSGGAGEKIFFVVVENYVIHCCYLPFYFLFTIIIITIFRK